MSAETIIEEPPFERERDNQAWARWLGRGLDATLLIPIKLLLFVALGVAIEMGRIPAISLEWLANPVFAAVVEIAVSFLLFCLWEPLFLANMGTTPGKWVMGIRVRQADGRPLKLLKALLRVVWVWTVGLAFGIPLASFIAMVIARTKLIGDGVTAWDQGLGCVVTHTKRSPIVWGLVLALVIAVNVGFAILERMTS